MSILFLTSALTALGIAQQTPPRSRPPPTCSLEGTFRLADPEGNEAAPVFGEVFVRTPLPGLGTSAPETVSMAQHNRQFEPRVLVVKVGDKVDFINRDSEPHEVHSEGEVNPFEARKNARDKTAFDVEFSVVGVSNIGCQIHNNMHARILTVPNSFHVRVSSEGKWTISGLPSKQLELVFWTPKDGETTRVLKPCVSPPVSVSLPVESLKTSPSSSDGYQPL